TVRRPLPLNRPRVAVRVAGWACRSGTAGVDSVPPDRRSAMYRLAVCALFAATAVVAAPAPVPKAKDDRARPAKRQVLLRHLARLGTSEHWWYPNYRDEGRYVFVCMVRPTKENPLNVTYRFIGQGADEIAALEDAIAQIEMT